MPSLARIIEDQQQQIIDIYLEEIKGEKEQDFFKDFLPLSISNPQKALEVFLNLEPAAQESIANHLARISDIQGRVRNAINSKFAGHLADQTPSDESSFRLMLSKMAEAGISKDQLEVTLKQTIISNSITAHPTNPYSTEYTVQSMELDHILAEDSSLEKSTKIREQIKAMIAIDPTPSVRSENKGKKTQELEVIETMSYMRNIYEQLPNAKRQMESLCDQQSEYRGLKIGNFYEMGAWLSGDGDGNPASTAETLQRNIALFKLEIIKLYSKDLEEIKLLDNSKAEKIDEIINKLNSNFYSSPAHLITDIAALTTPKTQDKIEDLIYRVENFGFHYAKIDVRHDAADITITLVEILSTLGQFKSVEDKKRCLDELQKGEKIEEYSHYLSDLLKHAKFNPEEILKSLQANTQTRLKDAEIALRIFGRLQVIAKNPKASDKLIIAECKNSVNALAAMFLLQVSGNSVNQEGSMNIVTLSESADDLMALPENIEALLRNETYRKHVVANGKLFYMIAKSDTQRRDGVTAQFAQELPPEKVTELFAKLAKEYPELKSVKLIPFNGGGHALQRGGGRIDEIPNVYEKAAMRGLHWSGNSDSEIMIMPPLLTTQGHQNGILFNASNAANPLVGYFSQAVYAAGKMRGLIPEPEVLEEDGSVNTFALAARQNRELFFKEGRKVYQEQIIEDNSPINVLFRQGPWAVVALTNVSSRPGKKEESTKPPQLTDQRAIGADLMCVHSGTHLISWYSARAGLEAVIQNGGVAAANAMYKNDKSTRDTFRSMAMSLFMTDFGVSWQMMIGQERPIMSQIKALAAQYETPEFMAEFKNFDKLSDERKNQLNKITLAHIEMEAIETAKLIYTIVSGDRELKDETATKELLKELWPDLAIEIQNREAKLQFAHLAEAKLTADLSLAEKKMPSDVSKQATLRALGAVAAKTEAPGLTAPSLTKQVGENGIVDSLHIDEKLATKLAIVGTLSPNHDIGGKGEKFIVDGRSCFN